MPQPFHINSEREIRAAYSLDALKRAFLDYECALTNYTAGQGGGLRAIGDLRDALNAELRRTLPGLIAEVERARRAQPVVAALATPDVYADEREGRT